MDASVGNRPQLLGNSAELVGNGDHGAALGPGAIWTLSPTDRQLDANLVHLLPLTGIEEHTGPELDVLIHVVQGYGQALNGAEPIELTIGSMLWLPRGSWRGFAAGPVGLTYLSVHTRRAALAVGVGPR